MKRVLVIALGAMLSLTLAGPVVAADPVRPFSGVTTSVDAMEAPIGCPAQAEWRYISIGSGHLRHLGRVDIVVDHCSWMTGPTSGAFGAGTITYTAASGDTLVLADWGTFELVFGTAGPLYSYVDLHWEVIGGTGRFAGATGHGSGAPVSDILAGTTTAPIWGEIAY